MYKRQAAIYWLVKFHPELSDGAIGKLVGTTKPTILTIRERSHWNINNIQPIDPVALGLCKQTELDAAVQAVVRKKTDGSVMSDDERRKLVSTEQSLGMAPEAPKVPSGLTGLEVFGDDEKDDSPASDFSDAESFFKLPQGEDDDEDEDEKGKRR